MVAPLAGSVDRNCAVTGRMGTPSVAPLAGSVDRNHDHDNIRINIDVAPLAGSVDRNTSATSAQEKARGRSPRGERG